jgi:flavin-dependent dehydrogenase
MAAIRCAGEGWKTLVLERKHNPSFVTRTCAQAFFTPVAGYDPSPRFYREKVSLVTNASGLHQFRFETLSFNLDYHGPLIPMRRFVYLSPSGNQLDRYPTGGNSTWCVEFNKEEMLGYMLEKARGAGVTIMAGFSVTGATDTGWGVEVQVKSKDEDAVYRARRLVAADGVGSKVVDSLGWNAGRKVLMPLFKALSYIVDDVTPDPDLASRSAAFFMVPSIHKAGLSSVGPYPETGRDGRWQVVFSGGDGWEALRQSPCYKGWFGVSRVVRRTAAGARCYFPLAEPARGNVIAAGDSAALFETLVSGAIACGYQAAGAIVGELNGRPGNASYNRWWREAFAFNDPDTPAAPAALPLLQLCTDDEMDSLFLALRGKNGVPGELALAHLEEICRLAPAVYPKLKSAAERLMKAV